MDACIAGVYTLPVVIVVFEKIGSEFRPLGCVFSFVVSPGTTCEYHIRLYF